MGYKFKEYLSVDAPSLGYPVVVMIEVEYCHIGKEYFYEAISAYDPEDKSIVELDKVSKKGLEAAYQAWLDQYRRELNNG